MTGIRKVKSATVKAMCKYLVGKEMFRNACFDRRIIDIDTYNAALKVLRENADFECGKTVIEEYVANSNANILSWNEEHGATDGATLHWMRELLTAEDVVIVDNSNVRTLTDVYLRPLSNAGLLKFYVGTHHFINDNKTCIELEASLYVHDYINEVISNFNQ